MACLNDTELLSFLHQELSEPEARRVRAHLAGCADCARIFAAYRRADECLLQLPLRPAAGHGPCLKPEAIEAHRARRGNGGGSVVETHLVECSHCLWELIVRDAAAESEEMTDELRQRLYAVGDRARLSTRSLRRVPTPRRTPAVAPITTRASQRTRRRSLLQSPSSNTWVWAAAAASLLVAFVVFLASSGGPVERSSPVATTRHLPARLTPAPVPSSAPAVAEVPPTTPSRPEPSAVEPSPRLKVEPPVAANPAAPLPAVPTPSPEPVVQAPPPAASSVPPDPAVSPARIPPVTATAEPSAVSVPLATAASPAETFVQVERIEGVLFVLREGGRESLKAPVRLQPADRVTPGEGTPVRVTLKNGVAVTLNTLSVASLAMLDREARAHLDDGFVYAEVPKNHGGFRVIAGAVEAIVKGTHFAVSRQGENVRLVVEEGAVLLRRGEQEEMTKAGFAADAGPGGVGAPARADVAAELGWRRPEGPLAEMVVYHEDFAADPAGPTTVDPFQQGVKRWGIPTWADPPDDWVKPNPASHRFESDPARKGKKILRVTKEAGKSAHVMSPAVSAVPGELYVWRVRLRGSQGAPVPVVLAVFGEITGYDYYEYWRSIAVGAEWQEIEIPFVAADRAPREHRVWLAVSLVKAGATVDVDEARMVRREPGPRRLHHESFAALDPAVWSASPTGWTPKASTFVASAGAVAILRAGVAWREYSVHASFDIPRFGPGEAGVILRAKDAANRLEYVFVHQDGDNGVWELRRTVGGKSAVLASKAVVLPWHPWGQVQQFNFIVRCHGPQIQVWMNGEPFLVAQDGTFAAGTAGFTCLKGQATLTGFVVIRE